MTLARPVAPINAASHGVSRCLDERSGYFPRAPASCEIAGVNACARPVVSLLFVWGLAACGGSGPAPRDAGVVKTATTSSTGLDLAALARLRAEAEAETATVAAPAPETYELTGDLPAIVGKKKIRFLVPAAPDHLPRAGDPRALDLALAEDFAAKLGIEAVVVPIVERDKLLSELAAGRGDVVVGSMAITKERLEKVAFTRPLRVVRELVVVSKKNEKIREAKDLAGKKVTVRPSSSYAASLEALKATVPTLEVKAAREHEDTLDLIQKVARGEEEVTVADSDLFAVAESFEPNVRAAFELTAKSPIGWALRKDAVELKTALDGFLVEKALTAHQDLTYAADLAEIKRRRVLRVLTRNASNCYFLYRGEQLGFEYELARAFAKALGVRLEIQVAPSREALFTYLAEGKADMIAAGLTITPERQKSFEFSRPYLEVSELVVLPAKETKAKELSDLRGKKIHVRRSSSYHETLLGLKAQYGFDVALVPEEMETEDILDEVGHGRIPATVADTSIVDIELTHNDRIRSLGPLGDPVQIAWVMRKDQPELKRAADAFIKEIYRGEFYNITVRKYFKNPKSMKVARSPERSDRDGALSPYDDLVRKWARTYELDWRLITSQMYQESRFDPKARSWVGALGLMQVMPATARDLKVDDVVRPENGIRAGIMLLSRYAKQFEDASIREKDRLRFALASYNCGPGHVHDARRLAKDLKLDPNRWFENVERAMLKLSDPKYARKARYGYCRCSEPVDYVSEIQTRYDAYSKLVPLE